MFDIAQAESNGNMIAICPVSSTSDIQVIGIPGVVQTTPPNFSSLGIESSGDITKTTAVESSSQIG